MDHHTGGKSFTHGPKRRKENHFQGLELPCWLSEVYVNLIWGIHILYINSVVQNECPWAETSKGLHKGRSSIPNINHIRHLKNCKHPVQGWGLLIRFPPFSYFPNFSTSPKHMLAIGYHVHIWQVSPHLSCGDSRYFCEIENFAYGEIDERSFRNPHPRTTSVRKRQTTICYPFPIS